MSGILGGYWGPVRRLRLRHALFQTTVFRLSLFYGLFYSLLTALILGVIYWSTTHYITAQVDEALRIERNVLHHEYLRDGLGALVATVRRRAEDDFRGGHLWLVVDQDDRRLAGNFISWPPSLKRSQGFGEVNLDSRSIQNKLRSDDDDVEVRTLVTPLRHGGYLLVAQALTNEDQLADHTLALIGWGVTVVVLIALLGGALMGRTVLRRIEAVSETAGEIMAGRLSHRIPVTRRHGDEFDDLATTLNLMLARIDQLVGGMREVTDNVSHDLRSPLTRLRNRLEVTLLELREPAEYQEVIEGAVADVEGIIQTFNALLSIAQAEAGMKRNDFSRVDLSMLLEDLGDLYGALADEAGLQFELETPADVFVNGNRELLAQAVSNLLDNAIKYTPAGGRISLTIAFLHDRIRLSVSDTGPGIPEAEHVRVLQRFVRLDAARSTPGSGLGLALVRAVAQLHDAVLSLEDGRPGLIVNLDFPVAGA